MNQGFLNKGKVKAQQGVFNYNNNPSDGAQILQRLYKSDGQTVLDKINPKRVNPEPEYTGVNVLNFAAGGTITAPQVVGTDTITHQGTATLTAGTGTITVGAGWVSLIQINGEYVYPCEEGGVATELGCVDGSGNDATFSGGAWSTQDGIYSWHILNGLTPDSVVDGIPQEPFVPGLDFKSVATATFDGVGTQINYGNIGDIATNDYRVTINAEPFTSTTSDRNVVSKYSTGVTDRSWEVQHDYVNERYAFISVKSDNSVQIIYSDNGSAPFDCCYDFVIEKNGLNITFISDGVPAGDGVLDEHPKSSTRDFLIGNRGGSGGYFLGRVMGVKLENLTSGVTELDETFNGVLGKSTTVTPAGGVVTTGAGGLESFWAKRIEDTVNGVWVDAEYNVLQIHGITQDGNLVLNGCEVKLKQGDLVITQLVREFTASGAGTSSVNGDYEYSGLVPDGEIDAGRPYWSHVSQSLIAVNRGVSGWDITGDFGQSPVYTNSAVSDEPPRSGWSEVFGSAPGPTLSYESFWVDSSGNFKEISWSDLLAHISGEEGVYIKYAENGGDANNFNAVEIVTYDDPDFKPETDQNSRYFTQFDGTGGVETINLDFSKKINSGWI